jgi:transcriptional regulator with XRE-family HTH domain
MSFREYLKGELDYKNMSVKELAYVTGIPKQTLDKYLLQDGRMPPADKAVSIARALDVSVEYLVTGKNTSDEKSRNKYISSEMRSIFDQVESLSKENRKIVEDSVIQLVSLLQRPIEKEPVMFTPLQKVFLRLFK